MEWKDVKAMKVYIVSDQGDVKSLRKLSGTCYRKECAIPLSKNRLTKDWLYSSKRLAKDGITKRFSK